ncbi:MAG: FIST C-terminal domain-containing protein [Bacteroidia bacterium]|nr:FIST C-terminal domain-containing protein [Bacteroidia bacterium]
MAIIKPGVEAILNACIDSDPTGDNFKLIFLGENNTPDLDLLVAQLNKANIQFAGGVFPGIISGTTKSEEGAIIINLPADSQVHVIEGLDSDNFMLPQLDIPKTDPDKSTGLIFLDGLTTHIADFLWEVHNQFGSKMNFFGGGAGSLSLQQQACLISNEGVWQDAALLLYVPKAINLGVAHGWEKIIGPFVATKTQKNVICELNWENAFEVYKKVIKEDSGKDINQENFFGIAKGYPFGLLNEGDEDIVRDPILTNENGELVCVGDVPENSVINILKGKEENLVGAATTATVSSVKRGKGKMAIPLVVDCISRVLFLESNFQAELSTVKSTLDAANLDEVQGILSLGEISSYGEGALEFFNKTIVVGLLEK